MVPDESDENPVYPLPIDQWGDPSIIERDPMSDMKKSFEELRLEEALLPLIEKSIDLLLLKDGDRDHMNHSDITCEQSMAIVEILRRCRLYFI